MSSICMFIGTPNVVALKVVNRSQIKKITKSRLVMGKRLIEFVEFRQGSLNKHIENYIQWNC